MLPSEWARSVKEDLVALQRETGIPAIFAASQMIHEGFNWDGTLSGLAADHYNFAGLTWYEDSETENWQRQFGATSVNLPTREVIDGKDVMVTRLFASYPSWQAFLKGYAYLLSTPGWRYTGALKYRYDPLLYCRFIANAGYATEMPQTYVYAVSSSMALVWDDYADTLPQREYPSANVRVDGRLVECEAKVVNGKTVAWVKPVVQAIGATVGWSQATQTMDIRTAHLQSLDPWEQGPGIR